MSAALVLSDEGTIDANVSTCALIIFPPGEKLNDGVLRASNGRTLGIEDDVSGTGGLQASSGTIRLNRVTFFVGRCTVICPPRLGLVSRLEVLGSTLNATTNSLGVTNDLNITGSVRRA